MAGLSPLSGIEEWLSNKIVVEDEAMSVLVENFNSYILTCEDSAQGRLGFATDVGFLPLFS